MNILTNKTALTAAEIEARLIRVTAWVEIMGKRAETEFFVESPLVCEGGCPRLQEIHDRKVAEWIFHSQCKNGFTVEPISDENTPAD